MSVSAASSRSSSWRFVIARLTSMRSRVGIFSTFAIGLPRGKGACSCTHRANGLRWLSIPLIERAAHRRVAVASPVGCVICAAHQSRKARERLGVQLTRRSSPASATMKATKVSSARRFSFLDSSPEVSSRLKYHSTQTARWSWASSGVISFGEPVCTTIWVCFGMVRGVKLTVWFPKDTF